MKHRVSQELHAYWEQLRGGRSAPERSDVDPCAIRSILADTFIVEIGGGASFTARPSTIRLSGTRLNALFGEDLKSRSVLSLWRAEDQETLQDVLELVLDDQVPIVAGAIDEGESWNIVELEMMLLPLRHHGKTHARMLGSIVPVRASRGYDLRPMGALRLTSFRCIRPSALDGVERLPSPEPRQHGRFLVYEGGR